MIKITHHCKYRGKTSPEQFTDQLEATDKVFTLKSKHDDTVVCKSVDTCIWNVFKQSPFRLGGVHFN